MATSPVREGSGMSRTTTTERVTVAELCRAIETDRLAARVNGRVYAISLRDYRRFATQETLEHRLEATTR